MNPTLLVIARALQLLEAVATLDPAMLAAVLVSTTLADL